MSGWQKYLNSTVRDIPPSGIRRFFNLAAEMDDVISLGVGEPDFVTPWNIREACVYALEKGYTNYTANQGLPALRQLLSIYLKERYNLEYHSQRELLVTVGVSEALDLALRAVVEPGDEVLIPEPCFVSYVPCTALAGGKAVPLATKPENNFQVTAEMVQQAITPCTKVLFLCNPNNPTGATINKQNLLEISEVVKQHDLIVISDEIYDRLTYTGEHTCFASLPGMRERTILLNGFSKTYAMTGWRVGYAASNPDFIAAMTKIHQYTMLCAPITAQMAAVEALQNGRRAMLKMVEQYDRRRRMVVNAFNEMGLACFEPGGAFYAFPDITSTGMGSEEFAEALLKEAKVAVIPGNAFGQSGEGFVRCSYATSLADLTEALKRIAAFVSRIR
ncbi:aminotransferase [Desulfohalotomaculum tongense]|uniref:aminotransferase class I/II-fold pyridoxal phosphate-dependent enzyme n=1 Tax=Desulforadius tongensis TaxID=1216062 RepID=UPI00195EDE51|nr:aminotransferase class I/II-fold pyridoxal phosphate-dependent enzyme [Desulforadius tongensis]MBM7853772.1 aminotransferase [Desulforadius tongensis]